MVTTGLQGVPGGDAPLPAAPGPAWAIGPLDRGAPRFLPRDRLDDLLAALRRDRRVVGPVIEDGAIRFAEISTSAALPAGWTVRSGPGVARLERLPDSDPRSSRVFDHGPAWSGIKPWTFPARVDAGSLQTLGDGRLDPLAAQPAGVPTAVIGARACDLAALAIHDRVLAEGPAIDPDYASRRADLLIVAVECALAASTCFCATMGGGPEVTSGADVVLAEVDGGFVARADTGAGGRLLAALGLGPASSALVADAIAQVGATRAAMSEPFDPADARVGLLGNLEHPRWDAIAERCLACANCTLVCPTCFCTGTSIESDLDGRTTTAVRAWDSCFSAGFAQVAGGSFRPRHRDRYRQWLTHKFATWVDQFGTSGCVGCGRCIAWCPVGIDVREELATFAGLAGEAAGGATAPGRGALAGRLPPAAVHAHLPAAVHAPLPPTDLPSGYVTARVTAVRPETADTATLRLDVDDPMLRSARPGQFVMVAAPAFAIPPISISRFHPDGFELTIRAAGPATSFLARLPVGTEIAVRGPLGRPWPIEDAVGRDVAIIAGGIGLASLRGLIDEVMRERDRFTSIRLYLGARSPRDRLYAAEMDALSAAGVDVRSTVDRAGPDWLGRVGVITQLFGGAKPTGAGVTAFVCGPERMMLAVADLLADLAVPPEHTWLTLERHMDCGVGLCGHCQLGPRFVCRDGPVFSVAELGDDLRIEGR